MWICVSETKAVQWGPGKMLEQEAQPAGGAGLGSACVGAGQAAPPTSATAGKWAKPWEAMKPLLTCTQL